MIKSVCNQFMNGLELIPYSYLQVVDSTGPGITTNWHKGSHSNLRGSQKMTETLRGLESPIKINLKFTINLVTGLAVFFAHLYETFNTCNAILKTCFLQLDLFSFWIFVFEWAVPSNFDDLVPSIISKMAKNYERNLKKI